MKPEEQAYVESGHRITKKLLKSLLYTLLVFIISVMGLSYVVGGFLNDSDGTWLMICLSLAIIFTIFYCTFSIIEAIEKLK